MFRICIVHGLWWPISLLLRTLNMGLGLDEDQKGLQKIPRKKDL